MDTNNELTLAQPQSKVRNESFGQNYEPTWVDRFGVWLSARQIRKWVPRLAGLQVGDFGCGFHAAFARSILSQVSGITLIDVALADDLRTHSKVRAICGNLVESLVDVPSQSLDVILCISVLEHLNHPEKALCEFQRILKPGGICLLNVPSWRGRIVLEYSAFRLGLSPALEMDDHKAYYDVKDFWLLLVRSGYKPSSIRCFSHKFGLNTFAVCQKKQGPEI